MQVLKEENNKMREEINELRKQVEMLMEKSTGNITNSNSNSNNNTHIETQNIILVNSFGNENTDYLTDQIITKLIKNNGPVRLIFFLKNFSGVSLEYFQKVSSPFFVGSLLFVGNPIQTYG